MKLATVKGQFAVSADGKTWHYWKDLAPQIQQSPTLSLFNFVVESEKWMPLLRKSQSTWAKLPSHTPTQSDFELPFKPVMFRDFYCFEEHVRNARKGRGADMLPEWYKAPVFYYSNHLSFRGPSEALPYPQDSKELDLELEIAAIIGRPLFNATVEQAREAILGYSLVNDWTARDFQRFEMVINMGPTKGKDFATTFGSYIVTTDEIEARRANKGFDIEFEARINNEVLTRKNWKEIQFSFEEMLVRASKNCRIYPGEVIASGTMGGGCLMEHNVLRALENPQAQKKWLQIGDVVTLKWLPDGPQISNQVGESES